MRITLKLNRLYPTSPLHGGEPKIIPFSFPENRRRKVRLRPVGFGGRASHREARNGRGGQIRTDDLYVPNVALYQAKLRPD